MRPAKFIPESKEVSDLLREMQEEKFHMADRRRRVRRHGRADHARGPPRGAGGRHRRRVRRGGAHGRALRGRLGARQRAATRWTTPTSCSAPSCPHGTWDTVGGLMLDLVGRVPDAGDSVEVDGFRLTAVDVRGRRIGRVRIEPTGARRPRPRPTPAPAPAARATAAFRTTGAEPGALGLRGRRRPAQRRQVDAGQHRWWGPRSPSPRRGPTRPGTASWGCCTTPTPTRRWSSSTRPASTGPRARSGRG